MPRPNILFIMDDQHRHDYLGAAGAEFLRTPHLDRLAAAGVRFTHCTTNAPICAPARIGCPWALPPTISGCANPAEQVWSHTKYGDLANFIPDHIEDLADAVCMSITAQHHDNDLIRGFCSCFLCRIRYIAC